MEKLKKELEELETTIKAQLDKATEQDSTEQLKAKFELAKADFNNYGGQTADKIERFKKWATLETTYFYLRDKLTSRIFEEVEQKAKEALSQLLEADEQISFILNNRLYYYQTIKHQTTQSKSNTIYHIIHQLKEFLQIEE